MMIQALLDYIGVTATQAITLIIIVLVVVVAWVLLRILFKITINAARLGCFTVLFIAGAIMLLNMLN